mgnify:CR=1 FL=1
MVLLVVSLLVLLMSAWSADPPGALSNDLTQLVEDSPSWVLSIWQLLFDLVVVWAGLLVVLAVLRRQFVPAVTAIVAAAFGVFLAVVGGWIALGDAEDVGTVLSRLTVSEGPASFPAIRLVTASAVLVVMSPAISRPYRFFGRIALTLGFMASVGLGVATLVGSIGGLAAGAAAAAAFENEDIYFEFDSANLSADAQEILREKVQWLKQNPRSRVIIEGHCDERGTNEYNLALGERRAQSAQQYLISLGIDESRLATVSYGEERPLDPEGTESAWAKNRRAHFVIEK